MQAPSDILCPISREVFELPLLCSDGFTYEKSFITKWIGEHKLSPMLGNELTNTSLLENKTFFSYLTAYKGMKQRILTLKSKPIKPKEDQEAPQEAKDKLKELLNHYYKSTRELSVCCKGIEELYMAFPNSFEITMNLANILRFNAQFEKALSLIKEMKRLRPDSLIPNYMRVRVLSESASKLKANQLLSKIQSRYRIEDHSLIETRFMSYALLSVGNRDTAYKVVMTYLILVQDDIRALSHAIYINLLLENFKFVTKTSKLYLKNYPDDASVMFHLAKAYSRTGRKSKAVEIYKGIASMARDPAICSKALYEAAINRDCDLQFEEMVQDLEASYTLNPKEDADGYLTALYADKKMFDKAEIWIGEYEKRINILNDHVFLSIKAQILEYNKKYEEAIVSYIRLIEIDSTNNNLYSRRIEEIIQKKLGEINA